MDYIIFLYTFERTGAVYSSAALFDAFYIRAQFPHDMLELRVSSLHVGEKSFACSICVLWNLKDFADNFTGQMQWTFTAIVCVWFFIFFVALNQFE